jgi:MFS family permease
MDKPQETYGFADTLTVLRIPQYPWFLLGRFTATLATQMQSLIVSWQVYQLTKDPLALGLIGLVEAVVYFSFALWAGRYTDRHEKKRIIGLTQFMMLGCTGLLFWISRTEPIRVSWIYGVIALTGFARSFMWPASFSYSELTVPRAVYSRAAAWLSTTWEVGSVVGPAVGGLIYAWKGPLAGYGVVAALMMIAVLSTLRLPPIAPIDTPNAIDRHDLWSGVRFVFASPLILSALALDMFAVLFGGPYAILPIFADQVLHVGPKGLGLLRAAPSVGAIFMAIYQAYRPPLKEAGKTLFICVALFGMTMIGFALSKHFWLSLLLLAASGAVDNISVIIRHSILQAFTPDHMRGRVSAVNGLFIGSSNEIGAFESGLAAKYLGTVPSVVFGGVMTLLSVAIIAWKAPLLRGLKSLHKAV